MGSIKEKEVKRKYAESERMEIEKVQILKYLGYTLTRHNMAEQYVRKRVTKSEIVHEYTMEHKEEKV